MGLKLLGGNGAPSFLLLKLCLQVTIYVKTTGSPHLTFLTGGLRGPSKTVSTVMDAAGGMPVSSCVREKGFEMFLLVSAGKSMSSDPEGKRDGLEMRNLETQTMMVCPKGR